VAFPVEQVPDEAHLFYRVHKNDTADGEPIPGAFRDVGSAMSTDWEKYSTPSESRNRAKNPARVGVVRLVAEDVRRIEPLKVEHTPDYPTNRAHTDVFGQKTSEVRLKLLRGAEWKIRPDDPL
jgi:hypothetical protein